MIKEKPRIALVCSRGVVVGPNKVQPDQMGITYTTAVVKGGGLPFLIPLDYPLDELSVIRDSYDGLVLIGGGDVDIARYGGKDHPSLDEVWPVRDELECRLANLAYDTDWPVFGICRGVQVMIVAAGGKLYSDIQDQVPNVRFQHRQTSAVPRDYIAHKVNILPGTLLHRILEKDTVEVNSFHHQAVSEPGKRMVITAYSEDGIPEGLELPGHPFALGVQWHPECMQTFDDHMKLFRAFVDACRK